MFGYLIDMDGVIYHGTQLIPGADRFIQQLTAADVPFMFLTNNSQRTRRDVATKLERMGIRFQRGTRLHLCHRHGPVLGAAETQRHCVRDRRRRLADRAA